MLDLPPMQGIAFIRRCDAEDFDLRIKRGSAFIRCDDAQQSLMCRIRFGFGYTSKLCQIQKERDEQARCEFTGVAQ